MAFVRRDGEGKITAAYNEARDDVTEEVAADDAELMDFLSELTGEPDLRQRLIESDREMARVTEDLVETLIENHAIMLPEAAQIKLMKRRRLRDRMSSLVGLIDEDDIL